MTINECMKAHEEYISFLNNEVLANCDRSKLSDSAYMTEILKKMTDGFCRIYDSNEIINDMDFVLVPAVIKSKNEDQLYAGLVQLDVASSGEHYATTLFSKKIGVLNFDDADMSHEAKLFLLLFYPYEYYPTVPYPDDIHVDWSKCPAEVTKIINECNSQSQEGGMSF